MLSKEEIEKRDLGDRVIMVKLLKELNEMSRWVTDICTQGWPYEGCPRGPVYYLYSCIPEISECAKKIYDRYLDEVDSRRSA